MLYYFAIKSSHKDSIIHLILIFTCLTNTHWWKKRGIHLQNKNDTPAEWNSPKVCVYRAERVVHYILQATVKNARR